jgi:hypothetical protein
MAESEDDPRIRKAVRKLLSAVEKIAIASRQAEEARRQLVRKPARYQRVRLHRPADGQGVSDG